MQLSYKALEQTLISHFHIHPDKSGTFRSRIKQLQRLGFPPGVNAGRGTKMEYSAEHLFQLITALELIGAGMPAERATKIVESNWPAFKTAYAFAVYGLRNFRTSRMFCWVLSRAFCDLQTDPYPSKFSLSTYPHAARVAVGDDEGLRDQLLVGNNRRQAHCYAVLPISDLVSSGLRAAENAGGDPSARLSPEYVDWLPPEDVDRSGWLFVESINPWEERPTAFHSDEEISTQELEEHIRLNQKVMQTVYDIEMRRRQREDDARYADAAVEPPGDISEHVREAADGIVAQLSPEASKAMESLVTGEDVNALINKEVIQQLYDESLVTPGPERIHITPLGWAVAHKIVAAKIPKPRRKRSKAGGDQEPAPAAAPKEQGPTEAERPSKLRAVN